MKETTTKDMELTKDEINRIIHEEIMGKCWHRVRAARSTTWMTQGSICDVCGEGWLRYGENASYPPKNPDYCSDDSPRSLLNEVVAKVNSLILTDRFADITRDDYAGIAPPFYKAEQIARACVEAWRSK